MNEKEYKENSLEYLEWKEQMGRWFEDVQEKSTNEKEKVDTYGKYIDEKNKQLDKEVEDIVRDAIKEVNTACILSGIPCDPDTSDGIQYIERCLEKMKKERKNKQK